MEITPKILLPADTVSVTPHLTSATRRTPTPSTHHNATLQYNNGNHHIVTLRSYRTSQGSIVLDRGIWPHLYLGGGARIPDDIMHDWVCGVIWRQLCDATFWIQLLWDLATLQPILQGGAAGGQSSHRRGSGPPGTSTGSGYRPLMSIRLCEKKTQTKDSDDHAVLEHLQWSAADIVDGVDDVGCVYDVLTGGTEQRLNVHCNCFQKTLTAGTVEQR